VSGEASAARARVTIYTRPFCGYCARALGLLNRKGADIEEIEAGFDPDKRREMVDRTGATTFPQIFIGEIHVGGCEELMDLDRQGKLDALLAP
jgi:glutaredoxin 3